MDNFNLNSKLIYISTFQELEDNFDTDFGNTYNDELWKWKAHFF